MPVREYYTVDRSPEEVAALWSWAGKECAGKLEHENPYAVGVLAALEYLMGETESRPQDYKGLFRLDTVLRQAEEGEQIGGVHDARIDQPCDKLLDSLRPGNPKSLLYKTPVVGGDVAVCERGIDNGDEAFGGNTDSGGGKR